MTTLIAEFPTIAELADRLSAEADRYGSQWRHVHRLTSAWFDAQPDLLTELRSRLRALPEPARAELAAASRETTTHFAWRLAGREDLPFSFWLHEYKPQRDWWRGYANSVHNHRYHFCTTVLAGGFQHEWYDVQLDPTGELAREVSCRSSEVWRPGAVRSVTAEEFHRVARATDGTLTFLVKSNPVREWSVSVDPATRVTRRHVPVEVLIANLAERI
jgi:hypothetical protein